MEINPSLPSVENPHITQEYLRIYSIKDSTVLVQNFQSQTILLPLSIIKLYNRQVNANEIQHGDILTMKTINSIKVIELYLEYAQILSVDSQSFSIAVQESTSYILKRMQIGNYRQEINENEIVRVFRRKDCLVYIIFQNQYIVDVLPAQDIYSNESAYIAEIDAEKRRAQDQREKIEIQIANEREKINLEGGLVRRPNLRGDITPGYDLNPELVRRPILRGDITPGYDLNTGFSYDDQPLPQQPLYSQPQMPQKPSYNQPPPQQHLYDQPLPQNAYNQAPPQQHPYDQPLPQQPPYSQPQMPQKPSYNQPPPQQHPYDQPLPQNAYNQAPPQQHSYNQPPPQNAYNQPQLSQKHSYNQPPLQMPQQHSYDQSQMPQQPSFNQPPPQMTQKPSYNQPPLQMPQKPSYNQPPLQMPQTSYNQPPLQMPQTSYNQPPPQMPQTSYNQPSPQKPSYNQLPPQMPQTSYKQPSPQMPQNPSYNQPPPQMSQQHAYNQPIPLLQQHAYNQPPPQTLYNQPPPQMPQKPSFNQPPPQIPQQHAYNQAVPQTSYNKPPPQQPSYNFPNASYNEARSPQLFEAPQYNNPYQDYTPQDLQFFSHSEYPNNPSFSYKHSPPFTTAQFPNQPSHIPYSYNQPDHYDSSSSSSDSESVHSSISFSSKPRSHNQKRNASRIAKNLDSKPPIRSYFLAHKQPIPSNNKPNRSQFRRVNHFSAFSSLRPMPFDSDSFYLAIGIGYLEHLCRPSTDSSFLLNFINNLKSKSGVFKTRKSNYSLDQLIIALESLRNGRDFTEQIYNLLNNRGFLRDYAMLLRTLSANIMESQGCDHSIIRQTENGAPVSDFTLKYLPDALSILVVFHNLNPVKLFQKGSNTCDLVIHLTHQVSDNGLNFELLYFTYQDDEDNRLSTNYELLQCMNCNALPHLVHFPQGIHKCCCVCSAKQLLQGNSTCTTCSVAFKPKLKNFLYGQIYSCEECQTTDYLKNLQFCMRSNRIVCTSCTVSEHPPKAWRSAETIDYIYPRDITEISNKVCIYCEKSKTSNKFTDQIACECVCCIKCYDNLMKHDFQTCIFCNTSLKLNSIKCSICNQITTKQTSISLDCSHIYCNGCSDRSFRDQAARTTIISCYICKAPVPESKYAGILGQSLLNLYKQQTQHLKSCKLCSRPFSPNRIKLSCGHVFDKDCLKVYFIDCIDKESELVCPELCSKLLSCSEIKQVLRREYIDKLVGKPYKNINIKKFTKCPKCNTSYRKDKIAGIVVCRLCKNRYCGECDRAQENNQEVHTQDCIFYEE